MPIKRARFGQHSVAKVDRSARQADRARLVLTVNWGGRPRPPKSFLLMETIMSESMAHEIDELINLVEIEMLTMRGRKFADESDLASLICWRVKLLEIAKDVSKIR